MVQIAVADFVGEPHRLERAVPGEGAGGVVVDTLARPRQEPRGGVAVIHDQIGVGLIALERDAHDHLAHGGAGHGVGAAESLRAEQHVNAEGAPLPDDAVQQNGGGLADFVIFDEQFLKFVDHQQGARHRSLTAGPEKAGEILHAQLAELFPAPLKFLIDAREHAQTELAVARNGDHAGVGQRAGAVTLELHALFEVHKVELHLGRAAPQREVGDDDMEQRGLAGTGFARNQAVLTRALAERQVLELGRAGAADGHAQFRAGVQAPDFRRGRHHLGEGHFHPAGILAGAAHAVDQFRGPLRAGRRVGQKRDPRQS